MIPAPQAALIVFVVASCLVVYAYLVYPLIVGCLGALGKPWHREDQRGKLSVSVVMAVRNESQRVGDRLNEILAHCDQSGIQAEIIVVSDGSTDATVQSIQRIDDPRVTCCVLSENVGKARAISVGVSRATGEIIVFCDARQRFEARALEELLANFADPTVGASSGELILESSCGTLQGVGLYWSLEKWIRRQEARWHCCIGVTGALCAVRRKLFRPVPEGTILDDLYWPLCVAMKGHRVVHDSHARAVDCLPPRNRSEFQRKVRTLSGNFQLIARLPAILRPWGNPVFFSFVSHKLARLAVPWALLGIAVSCASIGGPVFSSLLALQLLFYIIAVLGLCIPKLARSRFVALPASFVLLNAACAVALLVWISGTAQQTWKPVPYEPALDDQ